MTAQRLRIVGGRMNTEPPAPEGGQSEPYARVPASVARCRTLSRDARATYAVLQSYAWNTETCWPSMEQLRADLGACEKSVYTYLRDLVEAGLLTIERRGLRRTNIYHLHPQGLTIAPDRYPVTTQEPSPVTDQAPEQYVATTLDQYPVTTQEQYVATAPIEKKKQGKNEQGKTVVGGDRGGGEPPPAPPESQTHQETQPTARPTIESAPAEVQRAHGLLATLGVAVTPTTERAMVAVEQAWAERCERACGMTLEDKALDARAWLDGPKAQQKHRQPSVQFFRGWVQRDTEEAEARPPAAVPIRYTGPALANGHGPPAAAVLCYCRTLVGAGARHARGCGLTGLVTPDNYRELRDPDRVHTPDGVMIDNDDGPGDGEGGDGDDSG